MPPAERMAQIRRIEAAFRKIGQDAPDWTRRHIWTSGSTRSIPVADDMPDPHKPNRAALRDAVARHDWKARVKRKRRVNVRMRRILVARANGQCWFCGRWVRDSSFEIDHDMPVTRGGRSVLSNLSALCHRCNKDKSDSTFSEWMQEQHDFAVRFAAAIMTWCEETGTPLNDVWPNNKSARPMLHLLDDEQPELDEEIPYAYGEIVYDDDDDLVMAGDGQGLLW
jgi:hypothetical protein